MSAYHTMEIFYSLQGEGHRKGTANVFVRFAGCNLKCTVADMGFDCDTDFAIAKQHWDTAGALADTAYEVWRNGRSGVSAYVPWVIFTGGEPALQLDGDLIRAFRKRRFKIAIETNGTQDLPDGIDWVAMSPKRDVPTKVRWADEARFVIADGDPFPPRCADHMFLSPAWRVVGPELEDGGVDQNALHYCIKMCKAFPGYRLSLQDQKIWGVR